MSFVTWFKSVFAPKPKRNGYGEVYVDFYKRANGRKPHGQIIVSHAEFNIVEQPVNFVFTGLTEAPPLTAQSVGDLWSAAQSQGFVPHQILAYGKVGHKSFSVSDFLEEQTDLSARRQASVHLAQAQAPLEDTEYFSRRLQLDDPNYVPPKALITPLTKLAHDAEMARDQLYRHDQVSDRDYSMLITQWATRYGIEFPPGAKAWAMLTPQLQREMKIILTTEAMELDTPQYTEEHLENLLTKKAEECFKLLGIFVPTMMPKTPAEIVLVDEVLEPEISDVSILVVTFLADFFNTKKYPARANLYHRLSSQDTEELMEALIKVVQERQGKAAQAQVRDALQHTTRHLMQKFGVELPSYREEAVARVSEVLYLDVEGSPGRREIIETMSERMVHVLKQTIEVKADKAKASFTPHKDITIQMDALVLTMTSDWLRATRLAQNYVKGNFTLTHKHLLSFSEEMLNEIYGRVAYIFYLMAAGQKSMTPNEEEARAINAILDEYC